MLLRKQRILIYNSLSHAFDLTFSLVPQGSCLDPVLFRLYDSTLIDIVKNHYPSTHVLADDTSSRMTLSCSNQIRSLLRTGLYVIEKCIADIRA